MKNRTHTKVLDQKSQVQIAKKREATQAIPAITSENERSPMLERVLLLWKNQRGWALPRKMKKIKRTKDKLYYFQTTPSQQGWTKLRPRNILKRMKFINIKHQAHMIASKLNLIKSSRNKQKMKERYSKKRSKVGTWNFKITGGKLSQPRTMNK